MSLLGKIVSGIHGAQDAVRSDRFKSGGHVIKCVQCGNQSFERASAQLNTATLTFLDLDWANRSAYILSCKKCSHVMWFLNEPEKI